MSVSDAKVLETGPLESRDAKWIRLVSIKYQDPSGRARLWESAERTTKPKDSTTVDAVGIVALLQDKNSADKNPRRILLQKQFRAPADRVVIEVPAGLVDPGETAEVAALRELTEETGYVGELVGKGDAEPLGVGFPMFNDPGFCSTTVRMVHVSVDTAREENKAPKPRLEDGEFIECFTVELDRLHEECRRLEAEGYAIDARVGGLAEGIEIAKRFGLR